jgi:acyl carrier protein
MGGNIDTVLDQLITMCCDYDIFETQSGMDTSMADANLIESGMIDSMGLLTIQGAIEEVFNVRIPKVIFVAELRCLRDVARYLSANKSAEKYFA